MGVGGHLQPGLGGGGGQDFAPVRPEGLLLGASLPPQASIFSPGQWGVGLITGITNCFSPPNVCRITRPSIPGRRRGSPAATALGALDFGPPRPAPLTRWKASGRSSQQSPGRNCPHLTPLGVKHCSPQVVCALTGPRRGPHGAG